MTNERYAMLMLPLVVVYGLMILRILARYFVHVFGRQVEGKDSHPLRSYSRVIPPATELALASIVLDLSHIVEIWPTLMHIGSIMGSSRAPLILPVVLPVVLLVFHCQLYVLSTLIERKLLLSTPQTPQRFHMAIMNLSFGFIAVFTNAATLNTMLVPRGF